MRRPDARLLLWSFALVVLSGVPLMLWSDTDTASHAASAGDAEVWLRAVHSVATAALVTGALWHLWERLRRPQRRGARSGALGLLSIGIAVVTGAASTQTGAGDWFVERSHVPLLWIVLLHLALASFLAGALVYAHVSRWSLAHLLRRRGAGMAFTLGLLTVAGGMAWVAPSRPGGDAAWTTLLVAPPVPVLWGWTLLVPMGALVWLRTRGGRGPAP